MSTMRQYELFELRWNGLDLEGLETSVKIHAVFSCPEQQVHKEVKGFYAGNGEYVVRFLPEKPGRYTWKVTEEVAGCAANERNTACLDGAVEMVGEAVCEAADSGRHGLVRAEGTHFRCADGTWFYPFGTTVYAFSHQEDALVEQTFETLAAAPFNKIRICVFPKHYDYNHNDPEYFAFEKTDGKWDVCRPCYPFWDRLESHIARLDEMGIQCDLILFHPYDCWGFSKLTRKEALTYLDYVVRRLSAYPNIWWSLANEYDLMDYQMEDWYAFSRFLHENDIYGHLLSNHQMVIPWDFSDEATTHICHQTSELDYLSRDIDRFQKPLMVDECRYEGNIPRRWGNISGFELVNRFWIVCMQGGYCTHGETFLNETETLWWSKGGTLAGESPARIGFLRSILEELPGPLTFIGGGMTREEFERVKAIRSGEEGLEGFERLMWSLSWEQAKDFVNSRREMAACCGTDAYLKYYCRNCTSIGKLELPEEGSYDVEVIDVWEMTRTKVLSGVNGTVELRLPGKEGIAIMAVKKG
ncbi:MAG: DUF4038 domain-containing protein [Lachnospiraceae bacterium]|nr:DUF4038 domain-containing protein [Lachnospiraceae bacterium]